MSETRLHVERSGHGPPVLLLHGFTGSTRSWDDVRDKLKQSCTVIAVDLPGHGQSPVPDDPAEYALGRVSDRLVEVLDAEDVRRACVVGYSMGGRAALRFALKYPERCAGLVLESTSPGIADETERADRRAADEELARLLETEGIEAFVDRWEKLPLWASQARMPVRRREVVVPRLRAERLAQSPRGLANSLRGAGAGVEPSVLDDLPTLTMRILIIAGGLDPAYVAHAHAMGARLPDAGVYVEPRAGHAVHLEQPMRIASLVNRFTMGLSLSP